MTMSARASLDVTVQGVILFPSHRDLGGIWRQDRCGDRLPQWVNLTEHRDIERL
jgi:hypothetical protein